MVKAEQGLVWIDCEMTGLDLAKEQIIEIACIITDQSLHPVDEGVNYVIGVTKDVLDKMGEWCTTQHGKSGLTEECLRSGHTLQEVDRLVRAYIEKRLPNFKGRAVLAGNSVYADKAFLAKDMPLTAEYLHYRIVDVSSIKELARRWNYEVYLQAKNSAKPSAHRALDDIRDSIEELRYYKTNFFVHTTQV
ncbi:hypothetical protein CROQUDRAFT_666655 [Cronartium quercuum f. sp. fusiforme G11]|uniref:Exonuclease domain-containing protein n=1 Tax=Cronartium quercuum f. sp. fusiforme G11 TaxID=708437 RepID=A0A9P6T5I1_9BASI|nr:hypothetical protein CROQUDRAFT_666655 [Cronartium quercuum f. sp. fusiforme G11]